MNTKNKNFGKWLIVVLLTSLFILKACADNTKAFVQTYDQDGIPIEGVQLSNGIEKKIITAKNGQAKLDFKKLRSGGRIWAKKDGYYLSETQEYFPMSPEIRKSKTIKIELKKMIKPIPMVVRDYYATQFSLPKYNGDKFGYDLMLGDWVEPHGKGKIADFIFHFEGVYSIKPYGSREQYDSKIVLSFSNEKDGIIAWKGLSEEGRLYGSELASDYEAPLKGYLPIWKQRTWKEKGGQHQTTEDSDRNFYFRVRTKLDKDGNIISAHYGKIYGDFMSFIYYLNPTPNDRNVEFDTNKNLFKGESVHRP